MSLCCRASFGDMRACVCGFGRFKCHKLCCYFECIHSGDLHVILGKRAQSLNVYHRGTMARLIEPFVPFCQCMRACERICQSTPPPFAASHRKGLFGFIVQEGLCAQLAHLYKFSLYDVLENTCTRRHIHTHSSIHFSWVCALSILRFLFVFLFYLLQSCVISQSIAVSTCLPYRTHPMLDRSIAVVFDCGDRKWEMTVSVSCPFN